MTYIYHSIDLQSSTTATSLPSSTIRWNGCDIFNTSDSHSRTSKSTECRLCTWTWCFGSVATSCSQLHMEGGDADFLASYSHILSSQHSSIRRGLITICLDFHPTCNTRDGFLP